MNTLNSLEAIKILGVKVKTNEEINKEIGSDNTNKIITPPVIHVKNGDKLICVQKGLIPAAYINAEFDVQRIKDNVIAQAKTSNRKFKIRKFKNYIEVLNSIISKIRLGIIPECSYLIGAPNGFGKTSFVNTCIKLMHSQGWQVAPYISLIELAEIKAENEKRIVTGVTIKNKVNPEDDTIYSVIEPNEFFKVPKVITGCYSWSEYINADVLFCFLSSLNSKIIESHTLKGVLEIRAAKGLPTIVFMSTSLYPYKYDNNLMENVWDEILAYKDDTNSLDRVFHVYCYKQDNNIIGDNDLDIDV